MILEMIGGEVFTQSLKALAPFGRLVHFGQAARGGHAGRRTRAS